MVGDPSQPVAQFVKEGLVFIGEDSPMAQLMLSVMGALNTLSPIVPYDQGSAHQ